MFLTLILLFKSLSLPAEPPLMILEAAVLESTATGALGSTATGLGALAADLALVIDLRDLAKRPNFAKPFI